MVVFRAEFVENANVFEWPTASVPANIWIRRAIVQGSDIRPP
jgi:hypothetical protein